MLKKSSFFCIHLILLDNLCKINFKKATLHAILDDGTKSRFRRQVLRQVRSRQYIEGLRVYPFAAPPPCQWRADSFLDLSGSTELAEIQG